MWRKPIAAFLPANMDACALFRMYIPHLNLNNSRFVYKPGRLFIEDFIEADVVVVQRQVSLDNYAALVGMKKCGFKLVYDLDDNLWSVPAYNPGKRVFKDAGEGFVNCAKLCNILTVSTRGLESAARQQIDTKAEIVVVPNAIDFNLFRKSAVPKNDGKVVIGWAGSNTHSEDVREVWSALPEVISKNSHVHLHIVGGAEVPDQLKGHDRVKKMPWVDTGEYPARLSTWSWDIVLAPLEDNRFNRSKSNLKLLEAGAIEAAALASHVQPYMDFFSLLKPPWNTYGVCQSRSQWVTRLTELVNDRAMCQDMGKEMYRVTKEYFDIALIKENWNHVFEAVCG